MNSNNSFSIEIEPPINAKTYPDHKSKELGYEMIQGGAWSELVGPPIWEFHYVKGATRCTLAIPQRQCTYAAGVGEARFMLVTAIRVTMTPFSAAALRWRL